jgi:lipopolysaccharide transport system permease protein
MTFYTKLFSEIYQERELLYILAKRDVSIRYKQTYLGIIWAIIRPVLTMLVFLFAFKNVAKISDISGFPIQLIIFSGVIFWNLFSNTFQAVSNSILANNNLVSKVYFPRLIIAFSSIAVSLFDFFIGLIVYIILSLYLVHTLPILMLLLPLAVILTLLFSIGLGLIFCSFSVKYRDFLQMIPLIVQYGFFVSPIVYTAKSLQISNWFNLYATVNPIVGIVEYARILLIPGYQVVNMDFIYLSIITCFVTFLFGIYVFTKKESSFVDYL